MIKNNRGASLIILTIIVIVLIAIAGGVFFYLTGDDGVVSTTMKMDVETAEGEVRDRLLVLLNEELASASTDISGSSADLSTRYNEPALIYFLMGNQNFPETEHAEQSVIKCIEEFSDVEANGVETIDVKGRTDKEENPSHGIEVKNKYRVISKELCPDGEKYGLGKNIKDGNIFTLEAVNPNDENYEGKFELKYYDKNGKVTVLETVSLFVTSQS